MKTTTESSCCQRPDTEQSPQTVCCGAVGGIMKTNPWIEKIQRHATGYIPVVRTGLLFSDRIGTWKARWGVNRMDYRILPTLYAVGEPSSSSPVLVTANYKMSFDILRSNLSGLDAWILVLDTNGINVWCAAGDGTFGTDELVNLIADVKLQDVVSHRTVIVPQLGASGISAHEVLKRCGFRVIYGPVRACDIKSFISNGMKATSEMRNVTFTAMERIILVPIELMITLKYTVLTAVLFALLSGISGFSYYPRLLETEGIVNGAVIIIAWLTGIVLTPLLLPWLPGRSFSVKGFWTGAVVFVILLVSGIITGDSILFPAALAGWFMIIVSITSFLGMNFTGATPVTSLSGVKKEMKYAVPLQLILFTAGLLIWLISRLL